MLQDENWMLVEVWDEQLGGWAEVREAKDADAARTIIEKMMREDIKERGVIRVYSVVSHIRTVINSTGGS